MQYGTLITMANGECRRVERLDVGDSVLSFNGNEFVSAPVTAICSKETDENLIQLVGKWTRNELVCEGTHMLEVDGRHIPNGMSVGHIPVMFLTSEFMATMGPNSRCRYGMWIYDGIHEVLEWNLQKECRKKKIEYRNPEPQRRYPFEAPPTSTVQVESAEPYTANAIVYSVTTQWCNVIANGYSLYDY